jgi:Zn-finger nucleic acid-binding protein
MSGGGKKVDTEHQDLICPRDRQDMKILQVKEAFIDECPKCRGRFFDQGEMFAALGLHADPSYWDRPETMGSLADAPIHCPRYDGHMQLQTVVQDGEKVEIDRCQHCHGIWLDEGEAERIMKIGAANVTNIEKERAAAQAELAKMGDVDFRPGLLAQFLALFSKKVS